MKNKPKVFYYDCETNSQYAPYAQLDLVGILWEADERIEQFEKPFEGKNLEYLQHIFSSDEYIRVGFNCMNYDNLVLYNHDIEVSEQNNEDAFLLAKTVWPGLPAYDLKFLNWWFFGDPHWPEFEMENAGYSAAEDSEFRSNYLKHDLIQHKNIFKFGMQQLIESKSNSLRSAYYLDCAVGMPLRQMTFDGGLWLNKSLIEHKIVELKRRRKIWMNLGTEKSQGKVKNVNSPKQMGAYLDEEGFELNLTNEGEFSVKKSDLRDIRAKKILSDEGKLISDPVSVCSLHVKDIDSSLKFYNNYIRAIVGTNSGDGWIPTSYSISGANTRRFTSSSCFKINFQNPSDLVKQTWMVPKGWLGWYIDLSQIENIVHIYESEDQDRRAAYEADCNWNEYVWLCNRILGTNKDKRELDSIPSKLLPHWSVYKLYKTVKLALNFGMGVKKFCLMTNLDSARGRTVFGQIHEACPAIIQLQNKVQHRLMEYGFVQDVFGHIYSGEPRMAYKVVAYLIQGTGTASLPKAILRKNWETLRPFGATLKRKEPMAIQCGMTHDEIFGLIHKDLGDQQIDKILRELKYNMTERFSPLFDNIPIRSKLYLSETNAKDRIEVKDYASFVKQ